MPVRGCNLAETPGAVVVAIPRRWSSLGRDGPSPITEEREAMLTDHQLDDIPAGLRPLLVALRSEDATTIRSALHQTLATAPPPVVRVLTEALDRVHSTRAERALERLGGLLDWMEDRRLAAELERWVEAYAEARVAAARWSLSAEIRRLRYVLRRRREEVREES